MFPSVGDDVIRQPYSDVISFGQIEMGDAVVTSADPVDRSRADDGLTASSHGRLFDQTLSSAALLRAATVDDDPYALRGTPGLVDAFVCRRRRRRRNDVVRRIGLRGGRGGGGRRRRQREVVEGEVDSLGCLAPDDPAIPGDVTPAAAAVINIGTRHTREKSV